MVVLAEQVAEHPPDAGDESAGAGQVGGHRLEFRMGRQYVDTWGDVVPDDRPWIGERVLQERGQAVLPRLGDDSERPAQAVLWIDVHGEHPPAASERDS